jgi:hypothetical protein
MRFRRYPRRDTDPIPAAFTALLLVVLTSSAEQLDTCERTLAWLARHRLPAATFADALDELRLAIQARGDE